MKTFQKFTATFAAVGLLTGNAGPAFAQNAPAPESDQQKSQTQGQSQKEILRKNLEISYNNLAQMPDTEWTQTIEQTTQKLRAEGFADKANAIEVFATPDMKPILMRQLKEKMNDASQNGIIFLVCAFYGRNFCMIHDQGTNLLVIILWIMTWNDEGAVNY